MSAAPQPPPHPQSGDGGRRYRPFAILVGLVTVPLIILDQFSKSYVSSHMRLYESVAIIPNWLDITYTQNPGAAFSMFATLPHSVRVGFLVALSAAAIVVLLAILVRTRRITVTSFGFALIMAGAAGNLIDRAFRSGRVIDFVRVHYYGWSYPIFNVADSAITVGVILVLLASTFASNASE